MKKMTAALLTAIALFSNALRADNNILVRATVGSVSADGSLGDSTAGFNIAAGYQINDSISVELGYFDLGSFDTGIAGADLNISAIGVSATGYLPFADSIAEGAYGYARLGLGRVKVDIGSLGNASSTELFLGLGVGYSFSESFALTAGYEAFNPDAGRLGLFNIGLEARF